MYYANLAEIRLPKVPMSVQREFAGRRSRILAEIDAAMRMQADRTSEVEEMIIGNRRATAR